MKWCTYDENGMILQTGEGHGLTLNNFRHLPTPVILNLPDEVTDSTHYIDNGKPVPFPTKPGDYYIFDCIKKEWAVDIATAETAVRTQRDLLLTKTDWTDTLSAKTRLGESVYCQWQEYRQALRDITAQPGFPLEVVWPVYPK